MKLADSFKLSLNSILHRKLRAWLTLLGIIVGVAAVVSIISIGEGAQASVNARLSGFGADIITISPGFNRAGGFFGFARGGGEGGRATTTSTATSNPELTKRDVVIIQGNPNVKFINQTVSGREKLVFLSEQTNASVQGVNPVTWKNFSNVELASGRYLNSSDTTGVVIGDRIATKTFKQPITLGRIITIADKPFVVVGILQAAGSGFGGGNGDSSVFMPYESAWTVTDVNKDTFSSIQAKVADASLAEETTTELTQTLQLSRKVTDKTQDFSVTSSQAIQAQVSSVTDTLTLFLGAIAAVSLLVGAIGVANSMFTSVLEKTREIGILKALGATNFEVLRLFIIESALFGLVGGIIGAVIGTIISMLLSVVGIGIGLPGTGGGSNGIQTVVPLSLFVIAILLSTVIGIIAGITPARAAANLKPIEALRYE